MPITPQHQEIEVRFRELVEKADLPAPDAVEYEPDSVMFLWHGPKVAVAVDFDRPEALDEFEAALATESRSIFGPPSRRACH